MSYCRRLFAFGLGRIFHLQIFTTSCLPAAVFVVGIGGGAVNRDVVPGGRTRCMTSGMAAAIIRVSCSGVTRLTMFERSFAAFFW